MVRQAQAQLGRAVWHPLRDGMEDQSTDNTKPTVPWLEPRSLQDEDERSDACILIRRKRNPNAPSNAARINLSLSGTLVLHVFAASNVAILVPVVVSDAYPRCAA